MDESLNEKVMKVRSGFDEAYNTVDPKPYCYIREIFDDYVIVEEGEKLYKASYTMTDGEVKFTDKDKWKEVKQQYVPLSQKIGSLLHTIFSNLIPEKEPKVNELSGFSFAELTGVDLSTQTYIDGMAAGTFTSMTGEEVSFLPEELEAYVANTQKVIESTRTEKGEIVGLPIDENGHDHKGGAGWIIGLEHDVSRNIIKFLVNWTDKGTELVKSNMRRFFSPSVDTYGRYVRGGSLTNWPATRLASGQLLLRPVELSEQLQEIDMDNVVLQAINDLKESITKAISGTPASQAPSAPATQEFQDDNRVSPVLQELLGSQEGLEELGRRATEIAQDAIKSEKRKIHAVEFAAKVVGGTKEKPFGLRVRPNDLVALLLSLPERQSKAVETILEQTLDAAIDFSEHGVDSMGYLRKPSLPAEFKQPLLQWLEAKKSVAEFFSKNPEVGNMDDFNLDEFMVKE